MGVLASYVLANKKITVLSDPTLAEKSVQPADEFTEKRLMDEMTLELAYKWEKFKSKVEGENSRGTPSLKNVSSML